MSVTEINSPGLAIGPGCWERIRSRIAGAVQGMQHARMMSVLVQLTDEQLAEIGIDRKDIPARAHECIYGTPFSAKIKGA